MTYGEIRYRLNKIVGGVDHDILDGYIQDRYKEILDRIPWARLESRSVLQTVAEYNTGTVTVTNGSTTILGSGTTWTTEMSGRMIRISSESEYYEFTRTSETAGTLDRPYEGETASALAYQINASIYTLPSDLRILNGMSSFSLGDELVKKSLGELREMAPRRDQYGSPQFYAIYPDQGSDPPLSQVELYPIPTNVESLPYEYTADQDAPSAASTSLLPWMRPAALIAGVRAELSDDLAVKQYWEARFTKLVADMVIDAARRAGPVPIKMDKRYTRHRVRRWAE